MTIQRNLKYWDFKTIWVAMLKVLLIKVNRPRCAQDDKSAKKRYIMTAGQQRL